MDEPKLQHQEPFPNPDLERLYRKFKEQRGQARYKSRKPKPNKHSVSMSNAEFAEVFRSKRRGEPLQGVDESRNDIGRFASVVWDSMGRPRPSAGREKQAAEDLKRRRKRNARKREEKKRRKRRRRRGRV